MADIAFRGGKLPPDDRLPALKLGPHLTGGAAPVTHVDWLTDVTAWRMYGNDRYGTCTCAAAGHEIEAWTAAAQGAEQSVTDAAILTAYEAVCPGFDPVTGAGDNGAIVQRVLSYWRKSGVGGHKILAYAKVDHTNQVETTRALDVFGTLYLGISFPDSAMGQFNAGQPWDPVAGARIEGGHAINAGAYDAATSMWRVVTWGKVQAMSQAFFDDYVDEAWAVVSADWLDKMGATPEGVDLAGLGEDFAALTGKPNPFPAPTPTPAPQPGPVDADSALAAAATGWLATGPHFYQPFQDQLRTWLATRTNTGGTP
ncbi:MAG: hypothetical protein ACRDP1_13305 [Nocardioidaceae bacterium]